MSNVEDRRGIITRLSVLQYVITGLFSILAISFWVLQVAQHAKFEEMAENNHQRTLGAARAARHRPGPRRPHPHREPALLQHLDHARAQQGSESHDSDAGRDSRIRRIERSRDCRPASARADVPAGHDRAGRIDRSGVRRPGAPPGTAGRAGRANADATISGQARRARVRLRRRGERQGRQRGREPEERRHRRPGGHREGLQRAADGHRRRQARRGEQRRPRNPDARQTGSGRGQAAAADARPTICRRPSKTASGSPASTAPRWCSIRRTAKCSRSRACPNTTPTPLRRASIAPRSRRSSTIR